MKTITNGFKEQISKLGREIDLKFFLHTNDKIITENGKFLMTEDNRHLVVEQFDDEEVDEIINAEDIYATSIVTRGSLLSTMMKELDFEVSKDLRIGDVIGCQFGVKVNDAYEYIDYGNYMIYEKEFNEDTKTYNYIAYDRMLLTMQEANQEFLDDLEGRTLANAINFACGRVGLRYNATQQELATYPNLSKEINEGTFTDMQMTYRDVLDMIAQALGVSMIVEGSYLRLKPLGDIAEQFTPYEIKGNTTQEGTPTPDEPAEINNITGEIEHDTKIIDLGSIELCKIGTYQDKIYYQNNKWYLHKEIEKIVLDGTEEWEIANTGTPNYYYKTLLPNKPVQDEGISTHYQRKIISNSNAEQGFICINADNYVRIRYGTQQTVDNYKTWLSNNNVSIYYVLATATDTEITDTDLLNQLNQAGTVDSSINEKYLKDVNVSFGEKYGPINSVVLSRSEDFDNIYRRDEESIAENGLHEYKIKDNLIMLYNDREDYIDEIFEQLNGLEYYPTDFNSTGITYLDWLDFYNVTVGDKTYKCLMLDDDIEINQGLTESVYSEMPEETVTNYKTSSKTDKEVSFIVDKQNGKITGKVSKDDMIASLNIAIEDGQGIVELKGNTVIIQSDNCQLTSDGKLTVEDADVNGKITSSEGTIGGFTLGSTSLSANIRDKYTYTLEDAQRVRDITMGTITPTQADYERLDVNHDGIINASDYVLILRKYYGYNSTAGVFTLATNDANKVLYFTGNGTEDIKTNIGINTISTQGVTANYFYVNGYNSLDTGGLVASNIDHGEGMCSSNGYEHHDFNKTFTHPPHIVATPKTTTNGVITLKIANVTTTGFDITIGGSGFGNEYFDWIAIS